MVDVPREVGEGECRDWQVAVWRCGGSRRQTVDPTGRQAPTGTDRHQQAPTGTRRHGTLAYFGPHHPPGSTRDWQVAVWRCGGPRRQTVGLETRPTRRRTPTLRHTAAKLFLGCKRCAPRSPNLLRIAAKVAKLPPNDFFV